MGRAAYRIAKTTAERMVELIQRLLDRWPESSFLHYSQGKWLSLLERKEEAVAAFERAAVLDRGNVKILEMLAGAYRDRKKPWQELEALQRVVELAPTAERQYKLAKVNADMNRLQEAIEAFRSAVEADPSRWEWHYEYGLALAAAGRPADADAQFAEAARASKDENVARFGIGYLHEQVGNWAAAADAYELTLARAASGDAELVHRAAFAHDHCYRWERAAERYREACRIDPAYALASAHLGFVLERLEQWDEAEAAYRSALAREAEPGWLYRLGYVLFKNGRLQEAAETLVAHFFPAGTDAAKAVLEDAEQSAARDDLGDALAKACQALRSQDWPLAERRLSSLADRLSGHRPLVFGARGLALLRQGKLDAALQAMLEAYPDIRSRGMDHRIFRVQKERRGLQNYAMMRSNFAIRPKTIVYESYSGSAMSCTPLALFRNLLSDPDYADWLHIWVVNEAEAIPPEYRDRGNIVFVRKETDAYRRHLATASHLVNNSTFPSYFTRRPEQKYLNSWHGTPLKTLGVRMEGRFLEHANGGRNFIQATHLVTPNPHTTLCTLRDFGGQGLLEYKLRETGYPRIDLMLNASPARKREIRRLLGITDKRPILFYAPTWRGTHKEVDTDVDRLRADLKAMAATGHHVVYRGHVMEQQALKGKSFNAIIAPPQLDTNELLSVVDVLVTDYSSVFFDFIPANKPIFYYAYDYEHYTATRGFYLDIHDMPGKVVRTIEELVAAVKAKPVGLQGHEKAAAAYCLHDDGKATLRTKQFFFDTAPQPGPPAKKRILFFAGPFMANGITASFVNLARAIDFGTYDAYLGIDPNAIDGREDRQVQVDRLPPELQIIGRVGLMLATPEQRWVISKAASMSAFPTERMKAIFDDAHATEFVRIFGETHFDAAIHFEGYNYFWSALFGNGTSSRSVIYLHNDMYQEWFTKNPALRQLFRTFDYHDRFISVSEAISTHNREMMSGAFDLPAERFSHCPNLISARDIEERSREPLEEDLVPWFGEHPTFLAVGRLSPEKDHQKLVDAFLRVRASGYQAKLVVIGDGPLRGTLADLVQSRDIGDEVYLAGHRQNAFPAMKRASCLVLSSNHEGQPMVLLEAMTLRTPVIATDITGNRGVLADRYGMLVDNSVAGLTGAMEMFLSGKGNFTGTFAVEDYQHAAIERFYTLIDGESRTEDR